MQPVSYCGCSSDIIGKRELQDRTVQALVGVVRVFGDVNVTAGESWYLADLMQQDAELSIYAELVGALRFGPHAVRRPQPDAQTGLDVQEIVWFNPHDLFGPSVGLEIGTQAGNSVVEAWRGVEGGAQEGPRDLDVWGARWFGAYWNGAAFY